MKKIKKTLSLLLVIIMAFSVMTVAFTVFADTSVDAEVAAATEAIAKFKANTSFISRARPVKEEDAAKYDAKLVLYAEALSLYKPLSEAQKNSIDIAVALTFI